MDKSGQPRSAAIVSDRFVFEVPGGEAHQLEVVGRQRCLLRKCRQLFDELWQTRHLDRVGRVRDHDRFHLRERTGDVHALVRVDAAEVRGADHAGGELLEVAPAGPVDGLRLIRLRDRRRFEAVTALQLEGNGVRKSSGAEHIGRRSRNKRQQLTASRTGR